MIEQELLLLGLLREAPKHGYEIKTKIRQIFSIFAGVELKSIYYPLRILEKKKLVLKHAVKLGKRPKRFVYYLTAKGTSRFEELLNKSLLTVKRPQFSLDLSLYFLHYLKPASVKRRLQARLSILKKVSQGIEKLAKIKQLKNTASLSCILEHNSCLLKAEEIFLKGLLKTVAR